MILRQARNVEGAAGATLLEIAMAMLVVGLVATGIITAFIFSRRMTWRSGTELSSSGLVTETAEALRGAVSADLPNGLSLQPGIYVDENMDDSGGNLPAGVTAQVPGLNLPPDFQKFLTNNGTAGATVAAANHGDGRLVVVEEGVDLDGDGQTGVSFDGGTTIALRRVRVRVKWTSPTS